MVARRQQGNKVRRKMVLTGSRLLCSALLSLALLCHSHSLRRNSNVNRLLPTSLSPPGALLSWLTRSMRLSSPGYRWSAVSSRFPIETCPKELPYISPGTHCPQPCQCLMDGFVLTCDPTLVFLTHTAKFSLLFSTLPDPWAKERKYTA